MRGEAIAFGAATIVNAIGLGKGAALGLRLWTRAKVEVTDKPGVIEVEIKDDPSEDKTLASAAVRRVFERFRVNRGAVVETTSNIPIARGLKSSSAAANAVALATVGALGKRISDLEVINLAVDAAVRSGVTVTGAFDDACASYLGGAVVTDNTRRKLMRRYRIKGRPKVLIFIPKEKRYTAEVDVGSLRRVAPLTEVAWREALEGEIWRALNLNGYIHSRELGLDPGVALTALRAGALAAGLSGKGPATVAVVDPRKVDQVKEAWASFEGEV
ncbi:MAG: shikimate kinase, partial [Candidatus Bathyarchaeia archaeon]